MTELILPKHLEKKNPKVKEDLETNNEQFQKAKGLQDRAGNVLAPEKMSLIGFATVYFYKTTDSITASRAHMIQLSVGAVPEPWVIDGMNDLKVDLMKSFGHKEPAKRDI